MIKPKKFSDDGSTPKLGEEGEDGSFLGVADGSPFTPVSSATLPKKRLNLGTPLTPATDDEVLPTHIKHNSQIAPIRFRSQAHIFILLLIIAYTNFTLIPVVTKLYNALGFQEKGWTTKENGRRRNACNQWISSQKKSWSKFLIIKRDYPVNWDLFKAGKAIRMKTDINSSVLTPEEMNAFSKAHDNQETHKSLVEEGKKSIDASKAM